MTHTITKTDMKHSLIYLDGGILVVLCRTWKTDHEIYIYNIPPQGEGWHHRREAYRSLGCPRYRPPGGVKFLRLIFFTNKRSNSNIPRQNLHSWNPEAWRINVRQSGRCAANEVAPSGLFFPQGKKRQNAREPLTRVHETQYGHMRTNHMSLTVAKVGLFHLIYANREQFQTNSATSYHTYQLQTPGQS